MKDKQLEKAINALLVEHGLELQGKIVAKQPRTKTIHGIEFPLNEKGDPIPITIKGSNGGCWSLIPRPGKPNNALSFSYHGTMKKKKDGYHNINRRIDLNQLKPYIK
jgi:hypothetical protein